MAHADFYTMAAIAVTRSLGIVADRPISPRQAVGCCGLVWGIALVIVTMLTFSPFSGEFSPGSFGYDAKYGGCSLVSLDKSDQDLMFITIVLSLAMVIPLVVIFVSYLILILHVKKEMNYITRGLGPRESQVHTICTALIGLLTS